MADNISTRDASGASITMKTIEDGGVHTPVSQIGSVQKKFRDSFGQPLANQWDVVTGNGTTATIADGVLTVASGTTAGGFAELLTKETFTIPFRVIAGVQSGATRQANTHHIIEAVSVDPVTGLPDGKSAMAWDMGGAAIAAVTNGIYEVQNSGLRPLVSAASTIVTSAAYSLLELEPFADESYFHSRTLDSVAARAASYVRQQQIPDPNAIYKVRLRSMNHALWKNITGAVAGTGGVIRLTVTAHGYANASTVWVEALNGVLNGAAQVRGNYVITSVDANTIELNGTAFAGTYVSSSGRVAGAAVPANINWQFQFVSVTDYAELTAEITAGRGSNAAGQALSVNVTTIPTLNALATAQDNVFWNESVTAQAASAVITGVTRDMAVAAGTVHRYCKFRAFAFTDQAGFLRVEASNDNVTWRRVTGGASETPIVANTPLLLEVPVMTRYHRAILTNGGVSQTILMFNTAYTAN